VRAWKDELEEFIGHVQQCADKGPLPPEVAAGKAQCPRRECDAAYDPNLDDGVMINSAALWPLLDPLWKDPKKWWQELAWANPKGNKDYDWSHLAMKYWPTRVDAKCQEDPSLGVAHGCFWKYQPAKAWKWELRLQDEIGPDFRIEEASYRGDGGDREHRAAYLAAEAASCVNAPTSSCAAPNACRTGGQSKYKCSQSIMPRLSWASHFGLSTRRALAFSAYQNEHQANTGGSLLAVVARGGGSLLES